ncbi:hypothetical protein [Sphaerisporangium sp. NPDC051011]|uniref:hypothetical protein n=1 Tax=Sphaerisporangium sp. NPDC051011 TaxID=3155792 RepID=UPI0033FDE347
MSTTRRKPYPSEDSAPDHALLETSPFDGDLDTALAARPEGRRASKLTVALGAGVLLVAGMLLGIQAQKLWGTRAGGDQAGVAQALLAGNGGAAQQRAGGGAGRGGFGGSGGPAGSAGQGAGDGFTVGTVKLVDGGKLYVETPTGVVIVTTTGDTKVQVSKEGKLKDLKPGSPVVVQGTRGTNGSVSATTVSSGGALGGFGNRGGG